MVAPVVVGALLDVARTVFDRVFEDPAKRAAAELELLRLHQSGELAQLEVNRTEAGSGSLFVAGWRPFVGWVCGAALAGQFVLSPVALWVSQIAGHPFPPPPSLDAVLWELLFGMLGMGTLRTVEKLKGRA